MARRLPRCFRNCGTVARLVHAPAALRLSSLDAARRKVLWQCRTRNWMEMNSLLVCFIESNLTTLNDHQVQLLSSLLESHSDVVLYPWLAGKAPLPSEMLNNEMMIMLLRFSGSAPSLWTCTFEDDFPFPQVINRKLTDAAGKGGRGVLEVVRVELDHMNGVNLATALHRIARRCVENEADHSASSQQAINEVLSHPAFPALLEAVEQRSKESLAGGREAEEIHMPAQCASIVAWSLAWLHLRQSKLFIVLGELAAPRLAEFKPYEVTNMLWAYAKLKEWNAQLFSAVAARLCGRQKWEFKAQCLSVAAWSFTMMKWRDENLFQSMAEELSGQATLLKPQEISNTLWAFGKQKIAHKELFEALGWSAFELVWQARFKPKELANCLSAFARVGLSHPNLFNNAINMVIRRTPDFTARQIASILWAYQRLEVDNRWELAVKVLSSVVACRTFSPEDLCLILQSACCCGVHSSGTEKLWEVLNSIQSSELGKSPVVMQTIAEVREKMDARSFENGPFPLLAESSSDDEWYEESQWKAALQHPAFAGAQPETRCLNGKLYLAVLDPMSGAVLQHHIPSGVQFLVSALRQAFGQQDQDLATASLERFFSLSRQGNKLSLAEYSVEFDTRYDEAHDRAGLNLNDVGKFFL
eukprot:symbB.v1.2.025911.t1/scaffold2550.1/size76503/5